MWASDRAGNNSKAPYLNLVDGSESQDRNKVIYQRIKKVPPVEEEGDCKVLERKELKC